MTMQKPKRIVFLPNFDNRIDDNRVAAKWTTPMSVVLTLGFIPDFAKSTDEYISKALIPVSGWNVLINSPMIFAV